MPATTRHVWVQSPEHHQPPDPGLIIAWRQDTDGWWAWVVIVIERVNRSPAVIQRWMHQRDVIAAPTRPKSPEWTRWHRGWVDSEPPVGGSRL